MVKGRGTFYLNDENTHEVIYVIIGTVDLLKDSISAEIGHQSQLS